MNVMWQNVLTRSFRCYFNLIKHCDKYGATQLLSEFCSYCYFIQLEHELSGPDCSHSLCSWLPTQHVECVRNAEAKCSTVGINWFLSINQRQRQWWSNDMKDCVKYLNMKRNETILYNINIVLYDQSNHWSMTVANIFEWVFLPTFAKRNDKTKQIHISLFFVFF